MKISEDLFVRLINHRVSDTHSRKEDFVTEIVVWLFQQHEPLVHCFIEFLGIKEPAEMISVDCQVHLGDAGRVDARISTSVRQILLEHKVDAPYDQEQIERYAAFATKNNALLFAIIPASQAHSIPTRELPGFGGVKTWEEVYLWLKGYPTEDTVLKDMLLALLRLLENFGLKPIERATADWEDQSLASNVKYIRSIGAAINQVVPRLQDVHAQMSTSPWYPSQNCSIQPSNGTGFLYTGRGQAPRSILSHGLSLFSKFGYPWLRLDWNMQLKTPSNKGTPKVSLDMFTGGKHEFPKLLSLLGKHVPAHQMDFRHQQFQSHCLMGMQHIEEMLQKQHPDWNSIQSYQSSNFVGIVLSPTDRFLSQQDINDMVHSQLSDLYCSTLRIFLAWAGWRQDWMRNENYG